MTGRNLLGRQSRWLDPPHSCHGCVESSQPVPGTLQTGRWDKVTSMCHTDRRSIKQYPLYLISQLSHYRIQTSFQYPYKGYANYGQLSLQLFLAWPKVHSVTETKYKYLYKYCTRNSYKYSFSDICYIYNMSYDYE